MDYGHFERDMKNEMILTKWIVDNFLSVRSEKYKVIEDVKTQNTGVDFVLTSEDIFGYDLPYKIDFKAALNYVRPIKDEKNQKPNKMPTFAFELSFFNKNKEEREGWLFGEKYTNTEYYMLAWLWVDQPAYYNEEGYIGVKSKDLIYEEIEEVELMIIHKDLIRSYARKYAINEKNAIAKSQEMRREKKDGKPLYGKSLVEGKNYPKLSYSSSLDEKPVNLVISSWDLEKMAIFHERIISQLPSK